MGNDRNRFQFGGVAAVVILGLLPALAWPLSPNPGDTDAAALFDGARPRQHMPSVAAHPSPSPLPCGGEGKGDALPRPLAGEGWGEGVLPAVPAGPQSPEAQSGESSFQTLESKAKFFEARTQDALSPLGLVGHSSDAAIWSGIYVAAEAYRYAASRDAAALRNMETVLWGLHRLHEVTGEPGVIARVIRCGAADAPPSGEDHWHAGHGPYEGCSWKGDSSFDQYLGYLYGISEAWPYIQDPKLKKKIREDVRAIAMNFMVNEGRIVGSDTYLDSSPNHWYQERLPWWLAWIKPLAYVLPNRGGNAMHGLHLMKVAAYVTDDPSILAYYQDEMAQQWGYPEHVQNENQGRTERQVKKNIFWINLVAKLLYGWDVRATPDSLRSSVGENLGHIATYNLARLEDDPEIRRYYLNGLARTHEPVAGEANSYWTFLAASQLGAPPDEVVDGVESLAQFPMPPYAPVRNSADPRIAKYKGLQPNFFKDERKWEWFAERPLPFGKRPLHSFAWQNNATRMDGPAFETETAGGTAYLVAYWLGRHLGYLDASQ